jgi:hypothetical protein
MRKRNPASRHFEDALRQKIVGRTRPSKQSSNSIRCSVPGCALQGAQSEICYFSGRPAQARRALAMIRT